jgi:lactate 2-monooxygenase
LSNLYRRPDPVAFVVGRPWLYGAIVAGQEGVEQVIKHTMADLDNTMGQTGWSSLEELHGNAEEALEVLDY